MKSKRGEVKKMQNKGKTEMEIKAQEAAAQNDTQMLYEASMRGSVTTLNTLIQKDPFILHKISLSAFTETPLHISALLGHVEFTKAIVSQKPQLVTELDSFKRSPLHLAAAEGHREIVKELLLANKEVGLVADQEGRIPLHLAAMRGRVEVIQELISAKAESILVQIHGETVLRLCVRYHHLGALKVLVASVEDEELLNSQNLEGNTILQVSSILQQCETTRYLLSLPKIRVDANSLIKNGFAALDGSCRNGTTESNLQKNPITETITKAQTTQSPPKPKPITSFLKWRKFMKYKSDHHETTRGNLMVVATLIVTISFQIATNPPGGYWQADTTNQKDQTCPKGVICRAGTSIHAYTHETEYNGLIISSTVSFSVSLSIIFWLISGVPLRNRVSVGILLLGMWATLLFVAAAYYWSIRLVKPHDEIFDVIDQWYPWLWLVLFVAIIFIHIIRFCRWVVVKLFMGVIFAAECCCCKNKQQPDQPLMVSV